MHAQKATTNSSISRMCVKYCWRANDADITFAWIWKQFFFLLWFMRTFCSPDFMVREDCEVMFLNSVQY